LKAS
jgi:hypothetical protein